MFLPLWLLLCLSLFYCFWLLYATVFVVFIRLVVGFVFAACFLCVFLLGWGWGRGGSISRKSEIQLNLHLR